MLEIALVVILMRFAAYRTKWNRVSIDLDGVKCVIVLDPFECGVVSELTGLFVGVDD